MRWLVGLEPDFDHRHMLILVGVDSDDQLNTTTTFMTDDSCHFYLPEDCAPAR